MRIQYKTWLCECYRNLCSQDRDYKVSSCENGSDNHSYRQNKNNCFFTVFACFWTCLSGTSSSCEARKLLSDDNETIFLGLYLYRHWGICGTFMIVFSNPDLISKHQNILINLENHKVFTNIISWLVRYIRVIFTPCIFAIHRSIICTNSYIPSTHIQSDQHKFKW